MRPSASSKNPVDDHINGNEVWDAVIDGTYTFTGTKHYDPAEYTSARAMPSFSASSQAMSWSDFASYKGSMI